MSDSFIQRVEEQELFRHKSGNVDHSGAVFRSYGSSGNNPQRLAQLIAVFDITMNLLGWDKPMVDIDKNGQQIITRPAVLFSSIITNMQASIDGKYHNDYVKIAVSDEIVRKRRIRYTPEMPGREDTENV